jgi:hypothetical protein
LSIRSIIATDCGSTTTKAILIEKNAKGEYRFAWLELPSIASHFSRHELQPFA